jgi:hypothetical protein
MADNEIPEISNSLAWLGMVLAGFLIVLTALTASRVAGRIGGWAELLGPQGSGVLLNGAVTAVIAGWLVYVAMKTFRLRVDADGVTAWTWRGWRRLRWADVTRAQLRQLPGGTGLTLWRGDQQWYLTYAHFKNPRVASAFVAAKLPPTVRNLISAA